MTIYGIKCDIETESGVVLGWWVAKLIGEADLISGRGYLKMDGYLNKAAFEAGKPPMMRKEVALNDFNTLTGFNEYWTACCNALIAQSFQTGIVEVATIPEA